MSALPFTPMHAATGENALDAEASVQASSTALAKKRYPQALEALAPALRLRPSDPSVLNLKGAILTRMKDYSGAEACYEEALKVSPGYFPALYNIGALLALQEKWDPAITYYRNLLIDNPNNELLQYKLLLLLLRTDSAPALQAKLFASDTPSNTPAWYYASAARAYKKGDKAEAARYLDVAGSVYRDKTEIFQEELEESGLTASTPSKK